MVAVQSPLIGMNMDPEAAQYVAVLERRIVALSINELKFRTLLERMTGERWDTMVLDFDDKEMDEIAVTVIQRKLGVDDMTARRKLAEYKRITGGDLSIADTDAVEQNPQVPS